MFTKEELYDFCNSDIFKEIRRLIEEEKENIKNSITETNFEDNKGIYRVIKEQGKIEGLDLFFEIIASIKSHIEGGD